MMKPAAFAQAQKLDLQGPVNGMIPVLDESAILSPSKRGGNLGLQVQGLDQASQKAIQKDINMLAYVELYEKQGWPALKREFYKGSIHAFIPGEMVPVHSWMARGCPPPPRKDTTASQQAASTVNARATASIKTALGIGGPQPTTPRGTPGQVPASAPAPSKWSPAKPAADLFKGLGLE